MLDKHKKVLEKLCRNSHVQILFGPNVALHLLESLVYVRELYVNQGTNEICLVPPFYMRNEG